MVLLLPEGKPRKIVSFGPFGLSFRQIFLFLGLALLLGILVINVYVSWYGKKYVLDNGSKAPFDVHDGAVPVGLVLGASVYSDGTLSPMLEERAKTAFDLYKNGVVKKLLVSGDNRLPSYNEVIPIRSYLLDHGVPAEDVFTDFAGFSTYDSMYRAKVIFGVENVIIVTQSFHLPRAIYAARHVGLNAYGVSADADGYYFKNDTREVFATAKTFFKVATHAKSLFLGRQISIGGDGRDSLR